MAEAKLMELELQRQTNELIPKRDAQLRTKALFTECIEQLLLLPERLASALSSMSSPTEINNLLKQSLKDTLKDAVLQSQASSGDTPVPSQTGPNNNE